MTSVVWFRRDLRLHDHPALHAAMARNGPLVPVFCLDPHLLGGRHASGPRTQFLLQCLADLADSLRRRGSALVIRRGSPQEVIPALVREVRATRVYWTEDVSPFAARRDQAVRGELETAGVEAHVTPGLFVLDDPRGPRTASGTPYRVFTPFHRAWLRCRRREVLPAPDRLAELPRGLNPGKVPTLRELRLEQMVKAPALGGEGPGRQRMQQFLATGIRAYATGRDDLGADASSRLSPYLHFGCISPCELENELPPGAGTEEFRRQLCWRDFYAHVLAHYPANARHEFQDRYRQSIRWRQDEEPFRAWCQGRTGYPLVDAAMRQLCLEGWMHNRARLMVGSFLTKDLGVDWRRGEQWFMRLLIDGDEASNNGNWQWIASVGVDPQPAFRRIYNPTRQQGRFDPRGEYVRRYVPELRRVPDEYLAEPWTMSEETQREAGCVVGRDYPEPIVDHAVARREALSRYGEAAPV